MSEDGLGHKKRKVIGRATSETMMHTIFFSCVTGLAEIYIY